MPINRMLILMAAVAVSSTTLFAQDQTPGSNEKHGIVVETGSGAMASVLRHSTRSNRRGVYPRGEG